MKLSKIMNPTVHMLNKETILKSVRKQGLNLEFQTKKIIANLKKILMESYLTSIKSSQVNVTRL